MLTYFGKGGAKAAPPGFAAIQAVRGYWEALRMGRALPRRDQIDPRGIAMALENVFLIERIAPGLARFRLAGMHINEIMGMDVRGMPLTTLFDPGARIRVTAALEPVFAGPSVLELWLEAERGIGRPALEARMILLPLVGSAGEKGLALGCLASVGTVGRMPRRFAVAGLVREPVSAAFAAVPDDSFAESAKTYVPSAPRGKPNLRLVHSQD